MLFLQDFDIKWGVEQGINMEPANALSRKDKVDTLDDNQETTLLAEEHQDHHIQPLDAALATKIATSSSSDPITSDFSPNGLCRWHNVPSVLDKSDGSYT